MTVPFRSSISGAEILRRSEALAAWSARDGQLALLTAAPGAAAPTFTRATDRTIWDGQGNLVTLCEGLPGFDAVLNSATGLYEPVLLLEPSRINLCLQSENFGTTWAAIGTPVRTAAAKTAGDLVLDLLSDDDGAVLEGYSQTITFTGDAVKTIGIHFAGGTSTSTVLRLRDTTAGADRLLATITWAAGVPTVASVSGGVAIGSPRAVGSGVYVFEFQTGAVTVANVNSLQLYPATTAGLAVGNTGTVYAGGVYAFNAPMGGSYIKTTTATVTRNGEALSYPALWPQQDTETVYLRLARPNWASLVGSLTTPQYLWSRGATGSRMAVSVIAATRTLQVEIGDGTNNKQIAMPAGVGGFIEVMAQFKSMKSAPQCALDVGAGLSTFSGAGGAAQTAPGATVTVGDAAWSSGQQLTGGLQEWSDVAGLQVMETMRGLI